MGLPQSEYESLRDAEAAAELSLQEVRQKLHAEIRRLNDAAIAGVVPALEKLSADDWAAFVAEVDDDARRVLRVMKIGSFIRLVTTDKSEMNKRFRREASRIGFFNALRERGVWVGALRVRF